MVKKEYIEQREGGYWIAETRVSLDSIVYAFHNGMSPESIADAFPVLILEEVYGAITFYLANKNMIDTYLNEEAVAFETMRITARETNSVLYNKLVNAQRISA